MNPQLQLEDVLKILREANEIFYKDNLYVENVKRMMYFDDRLYEDLPVVYEQAHRYIGKYKGYFIYEKMKM